MPELKDLIYMEMLKKKMQIITLGEKRERGDFIMKYKLMTILGEIHRKHLILSRKGEARYLRGDKKQLQTKYASTTQKVKLSL